MSKRQVATGDELSANDRSTQQRLESHSRDRAVHARSLETNCYIVSIPGSKACWIVDASFSPGPMIEHARARGLEPKAIVLTHAHIDHIAGVDPMHGRSPARRCGYTRPKAVRSGNAELDL